MNVFDEIKEVVEVKVTINERALSDKVFDKAVMPILEKLTDIIPTEFDNALLAAKKEELRELCFVGLQKGIDLAEEKAGMDLDGKPE